VSAADRRDALTTVFEEFLRSYAGLPQPAQPTVARR
jgi:hypothetical protein